MSARSMLLLLLGACVGFTLAGVLSSSSLRRLQEELRELRSSVQAREEQQQQQQQQQGEEEEQQQQQEGQGRSFLAPPWCPEEARSPRFQASSYRWRDVHRAELDLEAASPQEQSVLNHPLYYCNKIDVGDEHSSKYVYREPTREMLEGLSVGLLAGNNVAQSRSAAMRDTWMTHLPKSYIFTVYSDPALPSVGLKDYYGEEFRAGLGYHLGHNAASEVGEISFHGMRYMHEKNPDASWYWMSSDDIWADTSELLWQLEAFEKPRETCHWLVPSPYVNKLGDERWQYLRNAVAAFNYTGDSFVWTSGGYGILMSRACLDAVVANWRVFRDALPDKMFAHANDAETGALLSFLGYKPTSFPKEDAMLMLAMSPENDLRGRFDGPGILTSHYVWPMRAISLEQWVAQKKLRALANAGDMRRLHTFASGMADELFEVVRRKFADVRYTYELAQLNASDVRRERLATNKWCEVPSVLHPLDAKARPQDKQFAKALREWFGRRMGPEALQERRRLAASEQV